MELTGAGLYSTTGVLRMPNNSNISLFPLLYTEYDYVKIKSSGLAASGVAGYFADKALGIDEVSGRTNILHTSSILKTIDDALKERGLFNVGARTALIYEILNPLSEFSKAYKANGGDIGKALEGVVLNQFGFDYNESLGAIVPAGIGGKKISYSREVVNEQAYSSSINMPIIGNINNFTTSGAILNISNSVLNINNYRNIPLTLRSTTKENTKSQTVMLSTNLKGGSIGGSKSNTVLEDERVMYTFLNGDNMTITIDTLTGEALQINGNDNTIVVNNAVWKSFTDAHKYATKSKSGSMAFSVINGTPLATGGSFSKGHGYEESVIVNNVAGIFGDNNTYNANTTHMEGAIMAGENLSANPGILTHADVEQYYESEQKRIGVSAGGGLYAPVLNGHNIIHNITSGFKWVANGLFNKNVDLKIAKEIREGTLHATISDPTLVGAINTDINASQEWETIKKKEYSATIPLDMLTQSGREEIKQNLEEIADVYDDIKQKHFTINDKPEDYALIKIPEEKLQEALDAGFEEEEIYAIDRITKVIAHNLMPEDIAQEELNRIATTLDNLDNYNLLKEQYGGEENIPDGSIIKIGEGKYYKKDGKWGYDSGPYLEKMHSGMVRLAYDSAKVMEIAADLSARYGKSVEYWLYGISILTTGPLGTSIQFAKNMLAEKLMSDAYEKSYDFLVDYGASAVRNIDPYLSEESSRNIAALAATLAMMTLTDKGGKKLAHATNGKGSNGINPNHNSNQSGSVGNSPANVSLVSKLSNKLADHDAMGGHGKARHGGHLTEQYVAERIARDGLDKYGKLKTTHTAKFYDEAIENKVLSHAFNKFKKDINDFELNKNPSKNSLEITFQYNQNVGHGTSHKIFNAGLKDKLPINTNEVTMVLRKNANNETYVHTIYPNIKNKLNASPLIESDIINKIKSGII